MGGGGTLGSSEGGGSCGTKAEAGTTPSSGPCTIDGSSGGCAITGDSANGLAGTNRIDSATGTRLGHADTPPTTAAKAVAAHTK